MTFKAYRAAPFNHTHENHAFDYLHDLLEAHWVEQDEPLRLLGNFYLVATDALGSRSESVTISVP